MEDTTALPDSLRELIRDNHDITRGLFWGKWLEEAHGEPYMWQPLPAQIAWLKWIKVKTPYYIEQASQSKDIEFFSTELGSSFERHGLKESDLKLDGLIQDLCMSIYVLLSHAAGAVRGNTDIDKGTFLLARTFRTKTWSDAIRVWHKKNERAPLVNQLITAITDSPIRPENYTVAQSNTHSYARAAMRGMETSASPNIGNRRPPSDPRPSPKRVSFASAPVTQATASTPSESRPSMAPDTANDTTAQSHRARPDTRKRRKDPRPNSNIFIRGAVIPEVLKGDIGAYLKYGLKFGDAIEDDFQYTKYASGNIRVVCSSTEAATKVIRRKAQNLRNLPIHMNYWRFVSQTREGRQQQVEQDVADYVQRRDAASAPETAQNTSTSDENHSTLVNKRRRDQDTTPAQDTATMAGAPLLSNSSTTSADMDNNNTQDAESTATKRHKDSSDTSGGVAEHKNSRPEGSDGGVAEDMDI